MRRISTSQIVGACFLSFLSGYARADEVDGWCAEYVTPVKRGLHRFSIKKDKQDVKIHAYAIGFPEDLDWGDVKAEVFKEEGGPPQFVAHYSTDKGRFMFVVSPTNGGGLDHPGGSVLTKLFVKSVEGKPVECIGATFNTPR